MAPFFGFINLRFVTCLIRFSASVVSLSAIISINPFFCSSQGRNEGFLRSGTKIEVAPQNKGAGTGWARRASGPPT